MLAATTVITTGCGNVNTNNADVNKPEIVDLINDYSNVNLTSEETEPINAQNFNSEVEKIFVTSEEKGVGITKEDVVTMLFIGNTYEFTPEDYYQIFEQIDPNLTNNGVEISNTIMKHNTDYRTADKYFGYEQFCNNPKERTILRFFDNLNLDMINCYTNKGKGYKKK